ncbi:unnamed protein product [Hapterophycus canaliculatus]
MQADAVPRNCLERLALDIFEAHTPDARFNRATSGAEWWTQVIDESDDIGWHWDKDYGMEAHGINVHPCLATVTYLSANGGPTIILEKKGPMACEDVRGVSGESSKAWISRPNLGKHICFDGRYLHAAPADLAVPPSPAPPGHRDVETKKRDKDGEPKSAPPVGAAGVVATAASTIDSARRCPATNGGGVRSSGRRVTFLVNVWLNHAPKTAAPLPGTTAAKLSRGTLAARLAPADFVLPSVLCVRKRGADTSTADAGVLETGQSRAVEVCESTALKPVPMESENAESVAAAVEVARDAGGEIAPAIDMRWEFGEVGDEADKHLRHEVLVPVPASLLPSLPLSAAAVPPSLSVGRGPEDLATACGAACDSIHSGVIGRGGGSFCVKFLSSRRPRVSRIDLGGAAMEEESSSEESEEDEESEDEGKKIDNGE